MLHCIQTVVLLHEIQDNVTVMRMSARILISLGVASGLFGALVLWTEWGQRSFRPDADSTGAFAIFIAVCCMILGFVVNAFSKIAATPTDDDVEEADDPGMPLCPSCLAPTEALQHFCAECGSPLTSHAEIDPIGRIYSMGDTFRKAAASPQRRIVLIGMWCIFALPLVWCVWLIVLLLDPPAGVSVQGEISAAEWNELMRRPAPWTLTRVFQLLMLIGITVLYAAIVIKTTLNYFHKKETPDHAAKDAEGLDTETRRGRK